MKKYLAMLLVLVVIACTNTSGLSFNSKEQNVVIGDPLLANRLSIDHAWVSDINGLLQAKVPVTSKVGTDLKLQYRFYWYDADGVELTGSDSPWRQVILHGKDTITLHSVARRENAAQYRVHIRSQ